MSDADVRNRKNKKSNQKSNHGKGDKKIINPENELKKSTLIKELEQINDKIKRDSGDGDSAPDTPPPETAHDEEELLKVPNINPPIIQESAPIKIIPKSKPEINFQLDGISVALFCLSFITRVYKLETPRGIVFDELHYGKYATMYMHNTFFFDSQPPLGKQLIAFAAYMAGYSGDFKFDRIGTAYDSDVPVVAMRIIPAFFGSLIMPTVYNLMLELGMSQYTGVLAAFLMIFDNAILIQSRFILMEGIFMFFGFFGLLCILKFRKFYSRPYSLPWFTYLILGATSLSAAICVRYFGLFTFLLGFGLLIKDFWGMVGDKTVSDLQLFGHFCSRTAMFVIIPTALYVASFCIHLNVLSKAGPNDNVMTSAFQASLEGGLASIISNQPVKVLHGSQITLRHTHGRTCWLHSHDSMYPVKYADDRGSSHQQQVTCYSYKDVNNWWIIKKPDIEELVVTEPQEPIMDGDIIQIVHGLTSRALNSHDVAAPVSPHNQEVSCYVDYNISMPAQNLWKVQILNKETTDGYWHAVDSQIRLIHVNSTQALKFSGRQLPEWGYRQHEIVTDKVLEQEDTIWNVEEHRYSRTDDQKEREKELIKQEMIPIERRNLTFFEKLYELQYKMLFNNQENVAGHMYASEPLDWITLKRGVAYWISNTSNAQIHFLGNVVIWLSGTASLLVYLALFVFYILRRQRACYDLPLDVWDKYCVIGEVLGIGYAIHYFPYFLVDRTLFLHHYIPAYMFKICILACMVEHGYYIVRHVLNSKTLAMLYNAAVFAWCASILYVFVRFSSVTYGNVDLTPDQVLSLAWRDTWDLIIHKQ